jgi:hypothetical protein
MRVVVLATVLLASSSLYPSFAQEQGKAPPVAPPQTVPTQPDQNSQQQRDQRTDRDQPRGDDREMGRDLRMRRGDGERMGREDREMGPDRRMHRDRDDDRIATKIPVDTVTGVIGTIENGTARSESTTTGVTTTKIGPAVL